jgi:hypothetical protein
VFNKGDCRNSLPLFIKSNAVITRYTVALKFIVLFHFANVLVYAKEEVPRLIGMNVDELHEYEVVQVLQNEIPSFEVPTQVFFTSPELVQKTASLGRPYSSVIVLQF